MKLGIAHYKVEKSHQIGEYLDFIACAAKELGEGMFMGPDYALSVGMDVILSEDGKGIFSALDKLSNKYPRICFVPGTMPLQTAEGEMSHIAPVFFNGLYAQFQKQTDQGEANLAAKNGLRYVRGPSKPGTFIMNGKKVWLQICGDRDRKPETICQDADLELILCHDINAGFDVTINTPENPRYRAISDGCHPMAEVMRYNGSSDQSFVEPIKSVKISNKNILRIFEIL